MRMNYFFKIMPLLIRPVHVVKFGDCSPANIVVDIHMVKLKGGALTLASKIQQTRASSNTNFGLKE